jgi:hypothetical protein
MPIRDAEENPVSSVGNGPIELQGYLAEIRAMKNEAAIRLIESWLEDESGYDEDVWETVKNTIEENRLSARKRFDG